MSRHNFEALVLPHRDVLLAHALSLTRDTDEAEDLVQETTLRALRSFATFRQDGPVRAWLLAILRNQFINGYRARARAPRPVSLEVLERGSGASGAVFGTAGASEAAPAWAPAVPGPERAVFSRLENEALSRAVAALPPVYRDVLVLSDMGDLTYQEIGDRLGLPIGTVRSRLSRARSRVRRALFAWRPGTFPNGRCVTP